MGGAIDFVEVPCTIWLSFMLGTMFASGVSGCGARLFARLGSDVTLLLKKKHLVLSLTFVLDMWLSPCVLHNSPVTKGAALHGGFLLTLLL